MSNAVGIVWVSSLVAFALAARFGQRIPLLAIAVMVAAVVAWGCSLGMAIVLAVHS